MIKMKFILVITFVLLSCGRTPVSKPTYFAGNGEQAEVILAGQMRNGQHCFYERKIERSNLFNADSSSDNGSTPRLKLKELGKGSSLLTPRSVYLKDLQSALASRSRSTNVAGNLVSWTTFPMVMSCYASLVAGIFGAHIFPVIATTCGSVILLSTGALVAAARASSEAKTKVNGVTSASLYQASFEDMEHLRDIFTWLESVDSAVCPLQPKFKTTEKNEEKT